MQISSSDLSDLQQSYIVDVESQYKSAWLPGIFAKDKGVKQPHVQPAIMDPKVARMVELYTRQETSFVQEKLRSYLVLLTWMAYIQIKINMKRAFDLFVALSSLPLMLPIMLLTAIAIKLDSPGP